MDPAGAPARRSALRLIDAVLRQGLPLEAALARATEDIERADDRALAHAIAAETLRRLPDLDALIDSATPKPLPHDAKARSVLRIALVQALVLQTPPHAAIATVLPLVEGGPKRLVHGVFGALMRKGVTLPELPALPWPVAKRWKKAWGAAAAAAARTTIAAPPPLDLSLRDPATTEEWTARLGGTSLAPGHVRLARGGKVSDLPGYDEGAWWVQDISASLPARLLGAGAGRTVLDLCAAPGGKTLQLAAAGWRVTALDQSEPRLARLSENLARTGLSADLVAADVMAWDSAEPFDAVLLDAPCSATGIFRRHPDVLHRVRDRAIADLAAAQAAMIARAGNWVKPDGRLIYSVCSLEPSEGEAVADAFAGDRRFERDPALPDELPAGIAPGGAGRVRVLPGMLAEAGGADGFFVARFRRAA
nr:transcription antitermination factor NusB [Sphingomonas bacterium]